MKDNMMGRSYFFGLATVLGLACLLGGPKPAPAQFNDLLSRIPGGANALVLIDVGAMYRSPMAMQKGWKEHFASKWDEQPILLPPEAKRLVIASHLNVLENMRSDWEVAVIELGQPLSLSSIARAEGGYIESIDQTPIVWTPSHAYFIELDKQLLGSIYPDDRQAVARWINMSRTNQLSPLSPYLKEAAKRLRSQGEIVLAIDLADVAQPHKIDKALKETRILEGKGASVRSVSQVLSTLRGVTLTINLESQTIAEARVDFGEDVRILKPFAKELVMTALDRVGASLSDPDSWKATVEQNAIILRGKLSDQGLRKIALLVELPTSKFSTLAPTTEKKEVDPEQVTVEATKRYYKTLDKLITDLRLGLQQQASNSWYERTARKIDAMPILNVDNELQAFGGQIARQLRAMAEGQRNVGRQHDVSSMASYGNYYDVGGYGGYGYYRSGGAERATMGEQARAAGGQIRTGGMMDIANSMAQMRKKLTAKYKVEF